MIVHNEDHIAAASAVAPSGTARRDVLLAVERDRPRPPALAGVNADACFIYKRRSHIASFSVLKKYKAICGAFKRKKLPERPALK